MDLVLVGSVVGSVVAGGVYAVARRGSDEHERTRRTVVRAVTAIALRALRVKPPEIVRLLGAISDDDARTAPGP